MGITRILTSKDIPEKDFLDKFNFSSINESIKNILENIKNYNRELDLFKYFSVLNEFSKKIPAFGFLLLNKILTARDTDRVEGLIIEENVEKYLEIAKPGDIMLTRAEGYYSNMIIPGFWKHMAMYAGTGKYIKDNFDFEGEEKLENNGHYIIEATTTEGVQLRKIDEMMKRYDYLGVFNFNVGDNDLREIIQNGLKHVDKKYDFKVDAIDDSKIFCAELFLHSYKEKLNPKPDLLNLGFVKTFLPNDFIKYAIENPVLVEPKFFIDNNIEGENFISNSKELLLSGTRTKTGINYIKTEKSNI